MSIKNCQAIQKSFLDRKSNVWGLRSAQRAKAWFVTLHIVLGRLPVTVLKSLNDRQSDIFLNFKESKEHIQLWYVDYDLYIMSTEKS